jgi:hypothetical protein
LYDFLVAISVISGTVAGLIVGNYFMTPEALAVSGGVFGWAMLHAFGGFIGRLIGVSILAGLSERNIQNGHFEP